MSDARSAPEYAPADVATAIRDAPFVRLVAHADGDSLAAAGVLTRALRALETPFQIRVVDDPAAAVAVDGDDPGADSAVGSDDPGTDSPHDAISIPIGSTIGPVSIPGTGEPASATAFAVARDLGVDPDPVLALAGVVAAGSIPGGDGSGGVLEAARTRNAIERRPGVGLPSTDVLADLPASTVVAGTVSGDTEATRDLIDDLGATGDSADWSMETHRRFASLVAIDVADAPDASPRAATSVERALRPFETPDGPFETVAGYADVLDALALVEPGTGIALSIATDPDAGLREAALETWRHHGLSAQRALATGSTSRHDGLVTVRIDAPALVAPTVARLARDFRSPEPVVLVIVDPETDATGSADPTHEETHKMTHVAGAATDPCNLGELFADVAREFGGTGSGTQTRASGRIDADGTDIQAALREHL